MKQWVEEKDFSAVYETANRGIRRVVFYNPSLNGIGMKENGLYVVNSNKKALYKISSCYPITDKYIDHEFQINGKHVVIKNNKDISEINKKFRKIIAFENRRPNYFPQRITDIKNCLITELNE